VARANHDDKIPVIIGQWRTGEYSIRDLAKKHDVSVGFIAKHTAGIDKDSLPPNRNSSTSFSPSFIYVITAQEFIGTYKIGLTNSIERRLADMQTGCPYLLFALRSYMVTNPVAVEAMLHAFFHKKRVRGEWFRLDDTDLNYIDDAMTCVDEVLKCHV
jgi:hypothetical protein